MRDLRAISGNDKQELAKNRRCLKENTKLLLLVIEFTIDTSA